MTDTVYPDHSYYQRPLDRRNHPFPWDSFRSNDGDFIDPLFDHNFREAAAAIAERRIAGFEVYYVYRPGGRGVATHLRLMKAMLAWAKTAYGAEVARKVFSVIDVESWSGQIRGDHSPLIRAEREALIAQLHGGRRKAVKLYANEGDRASLCPSWGDAKWIIANYSRNPQLRDQIAHQYSDRLPAGSLGSAVDRNSANGYSPAQYLTANGYAAPTPAAPKTFATLAAALGVAVALLLSWNPGHQAGDVIAPGQGVVTKAPTSKAPTPAPSTSKPPAVKPPVKPKPKPPAKPKPAPPKHAAPITHVVRAGETLSGIALSICHTSDYRAVAKASGIGNPDALRIGQRISCTAPAKHAAPTKVYTVRGGDTLYSIATAHHLTVAQVLAYNPAHRADPNHIEPGDRLTLPA